MYTPPDDTADEPEHVARFLTAPLGAVWQAFDGGRAVADEFFASEDDDRPYDPHLWAHLVRYQAAVALGQLEDDCLQGWKPAFKHHSSINLEMEPFSVLVCKAAGDGPQSPGRNRSRMDFFQQFSMFGNASERNLILYWMVRDDELQLGLCKPKGLWSFKGKPRLEWKRPIAFNPLEGLIFPTSDADDDFGGLFRPAEEEGDTGEADDG